MKRMGWALGLVCAGTVSVACGRGNEGGPDYVEVVSGAPAEGTSSATGTTSERLAVTPEAERTTHPAAAETMMSVDRVLAPDHALHLAKALEPEAPGTVHGSITATMPTN